jgi:hypothetical protein
VALLAGGACEPQTGGADVGGSKDMLTTDGDVKGPPDLGTVSFKVIESEIFIPHCNGFPNCHTNPKGLIGGGLDLSSVTKAWNGLVNVAAAKAPNEVRVKPGDVDNSFLWQKLTNRLAPDGSQGQPMPYSEGGPYKMLSGEFLLMIHDWIAEGAPNN